MNSSINGYDSGSKHQRENATATQTSERVIVSLGSSSTPQNERVLMTHDDAIARRTSSPLSVRSVMVEALRGFKRYMGYVGAHTAHIMGFSTDEEFERGCELFAIIEGRNQADLPDRIDILIHETGTAFEVEELSELFSATIAEVDAAMEELTTRGNAS